MSTTGSEGDILDMLTVGAAFEGGGGTERAINLFFNLVLGAATISSGMGTVVGYDNRIEPVLPTVLFEEKAFELEMI